MDANKIKVVEKATGNVYEALKIDGGYQLFTLKHDPYKKLKDSTIKRYYAILKEEDEKAPETSEETKATEITDTAEPVSEEKKEHMINKVKKMLALAENNPSQEEAIAAALQAQKLMAKYNIHEDEVTLEEIKDEIDSVFSEQPHDSHLMKWRKILAKIVAEAFRCNAYMHGKDVVFRGYLEDAKLALEVYLSLYSVGHALAKKTESKARSMNGTAKGVYNSFTAGFLKGVSDAFNEQCTALMIVTPKEVKEDFAQFCKESCKSATTVSLKSNDYKAFSSGYEEGKSAVKARALEDGKGSN